MAKKTGICYQFAEQGTCRFGDGCKFSHDRPQVSSLARLCNLHNTACQTASGPRTDGKKKKKKKKKRTGARKESHTAPVPLDHLDTFFAQYPGFDYNRGISSTEEFNRMCGSFGWGRRDQEKEKAHLAFKAALVQQFNASYGTDVESLTSWQGLCAAVGIHPPPASVTKAKTVRLTLVGFEYLQGTQY